MKKKICLAAITAATCLAAGLTAAFAKPAPVNVSATADALVLFQSSSAAVTHDSALPSYMRALSRWDGASPTTDDFTAVKVQAPMQGGDVTVQYSRVIDLSYNTKDVPLVEFIVAPQKPLAYSKDVMRVTPDHYEFRYLDITLTDIYDSSNSVTITYEAMPDLNHSSSTRVATKQQKSSGWVAHKQYMQIAPYGTAVNTSFTGAPSNAEGVYRSTATMFDYQNASIHTAPDGTGKQAVVRELANPDHLYYEDDSLWGGFTTGEVTLRLTMRSLSGTSSDATFYILSVNGQDLTGGQIVDEEQPFIRYEQPIADALPTGAVGKFFPLFEMYVYDRFDGRIDNCTAKAFVGYGTTEQIEFPVADGGFVPTARGLCTIVYEATDTAGNRAEFKAEVLIVTALNPMTLTLIDDTLFSPDETDPDRQYFTGDRVTIPSEVQVTNGAGWYDIVCTVRSVRTGEKLSVSNGAVKFTSPGYYTVVYTATDYLGDTVYLNKLLFVRLKTVPVVQLPYLPDAALAGKPIALPEFTATDYYSLGEPADAVKSYLVSEDGFVTHKEMPAGSSYLPSATAENVEVKVKATAVIDRTQCYVSEAHTIALLSPQHAGQFFHTVNGMIELVSAETAPVYRTADDGAEMRFLNCLDARLDFVFGVPEQTDFETVTLLLQDSVNSYQNITISITRKDDKACLVYVNGRRVFEISAALDAVEGFRLALADDNRLTINNMDVTEIVEDASGDPFTRFDSGQLYLGVRFDGVSGQAAVWVSRINNQNFGSSDDGAFDQTPPVIKLRGEIPNLRRVGDTITVVPAGAADVLDSQTTVTVSLSGEKSGVIFEDRDASEAFVFAAAEPDTYTIRYTAVDSAGNPASAVYMVYVYQSVKPTIALTGRLPLEMRTGQTTTVPAATAKDALGDDCRTYIYCITPGGEMAEIPADRSFTPVEPGRYTVRYYTRDKHYNVSILDYFINVTEESV